MNETSLISVSAGELQQERTLEVIAGEIRTYKGLLVASAIEIGRRLYEAKEMVPHGQFIEWVKINTGLSRTTTNDYMWLFKEFSKEQGCLFGAELNVRTFEHLDYTKVLALRPLTAEEREAFVAENEMETLSVREVKRLVAERTAEIEAERQKEALARASAESRCAVLEGELTASSEELEKARGQIAILKTQPVATVVERDEAAIAAAKDEGRAAASSEFKALLDAAEKELKEQSKKLAAAEKERDKAIKEAKALRQDMAQLDKAEAPAETVDKLRAQYEEQIRAAEARAAEAEKQLKLSAPGVADFSAAFKRAQTELQAMADALSKMADPETRAKLCRAANAVLENFGPKFKEA